MSGIAETSLPALRRRWLDVLDEAWAAGITDILVVQCELHWLLPAWTSLRNEIDETLMSLSLNRSQPPRITRLILQNLPVRDASGNPTASLAAVFEEWRTRLIASVTLLHGPSHDAPEVHRLIVASDRFDVPGPDLVELCDQGTWRNPARVRDAFQIIATPGACTPLTGYHMIWDGPFGDADPSVHL